MTANSTQFAARDAASDDLERVHGGKKKDAAAFEQPVK
jgi:hypothetical protein